MRPSCVVGCVAKIRSAISGQLLFLTARTDPHPQIVIANEGRVLLIGRGIKGRAAAPNTWSCRNRSPGGRNDLGVAMYFGGAPCRLGLSVRLLLFLSWLCVQIRHFLAMFGRSVAAKISGPGCYDKTFSIGCVPADTKVLRLECTSRRIAQSACELCVIERWSLGAMRWICKHVNQTVGAWVAIEQAPIRQILNTRNRMLHKRSHVVVHPPFCVSVILRRQHARRLLRKKRCGGTNGKTCDDTQSAEKHEQPHSRVEVR